MSPEEVALASMRRRDIVRTSDYRQTSNDSAVLQAVLDYGPVARSTIARLVGLSPAAVSRLSTELVAGGLLRESPAAAGPKAVGRPHVPVEIDTTRRVASGLHIAVRHSVLTLLDLRGGVIAQERLPHLAASPREVTLRAARRIPEFLAQHAGGRAPLGLGVAVGGWVDRTDGVVVDHPRLGWRGVPLRRLLEEATGLPVRVDNQARALARAEQLFGDARARGSVVQLLVANMIDAAFATGGKIHHGPQSAAGSVAHLPLEGRSERCVCGRRGCLQAVVASDELGARAARAGITAEPSFDALLAVARRGDQRAVALLEERARLIGAAAALLLDVLNPELLVVAEAGVTHLPGCLEILRAEVSERTRGRADPGCPVIATSFGDLIQQVGAGTVILDAVYANPLRYAAAPSQAADGIELIQLVAMLTRATHIPYR
jgi:predicted NBD/HSP70 family sugar kinase